MTDEQFRSLAQMLNLMLQALFAIAFMVLTCGSFYIVRCLVDVFKGGA